MIVRGLFIYPLRGCCANWVHKKSWPVSREGLYLDRQWCLVNLDSSNLLSQKNCPRLSLVYPEIDLEDGFLRIRVHQSLWGSLSMREGVSLPLGDYIEDKNSSHLDVHDILDEAHNETIQVSLYQSLEIEEFFTAALGVRCMIARVLNRVCLPRACDLPTAGMDEIRVVDRLDSLNDESGNPLSLAEGSSPTHLRPTPVVVAENARVNVLLSTEANAGKTHRHGDQTWYFLRLGEQIVSDDHSQQCHIGQMKKMAASTERRSAADFTARAPLKKVTWELHEARRDSGKEFVHGSIALAIGQVIDL